MKKLFLSIPLTAVLALSANAGVYRVAKHVAVPAYKHALKPAAKVAAFPVRHPKKSAHGLAHAGKKVAHVAKRVAD